MRQLVSTDSFVLLIFSQQLQVASFCTRCFLTALQGWASFEICIIKWGTKANVASFCSRWGLMPEGHGEGDVAESEL